MHAHRSLVRHRAVMRDAWHAHRVGTGPSDVLVAVAILIASAAWIARLVIIGG